MMPLDAAREFLRQGRIGDAERAYERALERTPDDVEALTVVGLAALRAGRPQRARELLGRAVALEPGNPVARQHLGRALELAGDALGAAESYAVALRLKPDLAPARIQYAALLERAGDPDAAAIHYARALQDAQRAGRWLDARTTPESLRPLVEHAVRAVRASRRRTYERLVAPLVAKYGRASLDRVETCLRVYLNELAPEYPDPRQRPGFLFFPGLPTTPYFDRQAVPYLDALETRTAEIRAELQALLPSPSGRERVFTSDALEQANLRGDDRAPSWNGYYFRRHGERREDNCVACPATTDALEALPLCHVRAHGPEVLFSVFTPGTHLLPHRGVTNTRIVGHLPLIVPPGCALNVGGEVHEWVEGRAIAFDDTYEHEAWNRGDRTRVVLIFDLWNPYLSEVERLAIADLVASLGDFRHSIETA
jgi:aspartate beta-hydroxylase